MGQLVSSTLKSIDGGDASAQETKDTLNALYALGQSRVDAAYSQAMSDRGKMYAPISKVILRRQQIVCKASTDTNGIAQGIKDSVGKLMNGQILDGVVDLIQNGMNIVLGSSTGQISSTYTYALVATDLGGLLRIDVDIYNFALQSQGLQTKIQNMTAISALVSSIDPTMLTASDLRAIISVSYGGSTIEDQQKILDLVQKAWEMDKKQLDKTSEGVTEHDLAEYRALVRPSRFDALKPSRDTALVVPRPPPKVDRAALQRAFTRAQVPNGAKPADITESPIRIWIKLSNPAEEMFITWLKGIMTGLTVPNIFTFKEIDANGYSGDALGLNCSINAATNELFEVAIKYVEDTVLMCLNNGGLFTRWISTMGIQYKHPGTDTSGFAARVAFKNNAIQNLSTDTVQILESETARVLLELKPNDTGTFTGIVDYISGPVQAPPADGAANEVGTQVQASKWVTYDSAAAEKILTTMPITLHNNSSGGYALSFTGPDDLPYTLVYGEAWPR